MLAGKVVRGFELGISTMTVGERAIISMHPDYAFGRGGKPPAIPADTWVIFDTEIVNIRGTFLFSFSCKIIIIVGKKVARSRYFSYFPIKT